MPTKAIKCRQYLAVFGHFSHGFRTSCYIHTSDRAGAGKVALEEGIVLDRACRPRKNSSALAQCLNLVCCPSNAHPGYPATSPNCKGCAGSPSSQSSCITVTLAWRGRGFTTRRSGDGRASTYSLSSPASSSLQSCLRHAASRTTFATSMGRRALRIWPVYVLVLVVVYLNAPWFIGPTVWDAVKAAPWLAYILLLQNLFHITLPPAIGPTWSLAVEEQYYFAWAPLVRFLNRPAYLTAVLAVALAGSPLLRLTQWPWLTPTNTLIHLDGIALGSLLALGLHSLNLPRRSWFWLGFRLLWSRHRRRSHLCRGYGVPRLRPGARIRWRNDHGDCINWRQEPNQRRTAIRSARFLRPYQLWALYDPHCRVHLLRLVRPQDGPLRRRRQFGRRSLPSGGVHRRRHSPLVRIRIANPEAEAIFLTCASSNCCNIQTN